ncbi:MAG: hypothetical protein RLZZ450_3718 [Pseudomonadota bacterium]|jgi:carbamoyl-phosphate synthase large subunit
MSPPLPLTVAVTGLNATDNPAPGVAVLRALKLQREPCDRLIGLAYDGLDPGVYAEDVVDEVFMLPYPSSSTDAYFERLAHIHERVGLSVVIPTLDAELPTFIALAPRLAELGIGTLLPTREQYDLRSKAQLSKLAERAGIRTPETFVISSALDIASAHERLGYPFFVKGVYYGATLVTCAEETLAAFHRVVEQWGPPVILQAAAGGDEREERNVVALGDGRGGLLGAVAMKKLAVTDKGKGWAGITIKDPELIALTERFMRATHWQGPCEIEVVRGQDGIYDLIEINPRFPAWVFLSAAAGMNLPRHAVELAAGRCPPPLLDYTAGALFVRISIDQIAHIGDLERIVTLGEIDRRSPKRGRPEFVSSVHTTRPEQEIDL